MSNKLLLYSSCLIAVIADMLFVYCAKTEKASTFLLIGTFLLNAIGCFIWVYCMKKGIESAIAITVYAIITTLGCTLLGSLLFKEHLSVINIIGIFTAILALILINK